MKRILLFAVFLMVQFGFGQSSQTFSTSGSFTVPAGVTSISVQAWGAGGGGHNSFNRGGGGGAFSATYSIAVVPNTTYSVTVGVGGGAGNDGQDSSFGSLVIAKGGKSGITGNGGLASESTGVVKFDGGNGGSSTSNGGAGGGGAAGTLNNGLVGASSSNSNGGNGGNGGANGGGNGGRGGNNNQDGVNGIAPGGGGGERGENGGSSGGGGNGQVIVSWTCPVFAATSYGTTQSICYNNDVAGTNIGRVTYSNVPTDRYIALNVVSGIQYRIATTNGDRGFIKRLTLFNGSNTTTALVTANATATNTAATIDWTATFTGVLYVVFNTANCQTSTQTDTISASYIGGGNNVDSQTAAGTNSWIGHVYNFLDSVPIGAAGTPGPSDSSAFSSYIGYFNQANTVSGSTISFNNNYGGTETCLNVTSGGTTQTVYTETFSVRYRMQTTSAVYPAGCYFVNIAGDDGVRLYIDDTLVFNSWIQQGTTNYNNVLVYLNGNSKLLFDFYEKNGGNVSNFSIFPATTTINSLNTVTPAGPIPRCINTATSLTGGIVATQGNNTIPPVQYQWQFSTDNSTWTDISGATSKDYTVPGTSPTAATQIYYKRNVRSTVNSSACEYSSNVVSIVTSPSNTTPLVPTSGAGTNISCSSFTANWASSPSATSYRLDVSTVNNFTSFVTGYSDLPVGFVTSYNVTGLAAGTYFYRVRAVNGCGNTTSSSSLVQTVTTVNPSATISGTTSVCQNAALPNITFTNPGTSAITVTYRVNGGADQTINVGANTTANVVAPTTTSGTFAYSLVSVAYQSAPTCSTAITGTATITVNPPPTVANAGLDQTGTATCGLTSVTLAGNEPAVGIGTWTIVNGTGGTITTPSSPSSTFTGTAGNTYTLRWTITNSPCASSTDDVVITFNINPTITTTGSVTPVLYNSSTTIATSMPYTASTNNPVSYAINWDTIADQGTTPFVFAAGGGTITGILVPAGTPFGFYNGTMTITNGTDCSSTQPITLIVQPSPAPPIAVSPNLWLKASAGVTNSGSDLTAWEDQTKINTFTKHGTIGYETNSINFNPTVSFNNTDSNTVLPTNRLDGNTNISFVDGFAVYKYSSTTRRGAVVGGTVSGSKYGEAVFAADDDLRVYVGNGLNASYQSYENLNLDNTFDINNLDVSLATFPYATGRMNGIDKSITDGSSTISDFSNIMLTPMIGGTNNTGGNIPVSGWYPFNGQVAEVIFYPSSLSVTDKLKVESYLAIKYGITLDPIVGNYLDKAGVAVWNNATYWHDVFGIGKEDSSLLSQPQSNSINTGSGNGTGQNGKGNIVLSNPSSLDNGDFLMIGHNNQALSETTVDLPTSLSGSCVRRLTREWKVKRTGDVGTTQLSFDWNGITVSGALPVIPGDYYLIIDEDGDGNFATGTITVNNVGDFTTTTTNVIRYNEVTLPDGAVFTFGISKKVTWTGATSTDWNLASNWSPNTVPSSIHCVVIPEVTNNPIITGTNTTSNAYTLEVRTNGSLTVNSTNTLSVAQTVTVASGGTLTFEDQSSLVQDVATTTNSNSGEITYKRISSPMKNFDYTYWSSPVTGPTVESPVLGQTAKLLSPNTLADKYFRFDGDVAVNDWVFDDGVMTPGVGFIIRVPKPGTTYPNGENWNTPTYSQPVAFKGTPNNGNYFFTAGAGEFNLIGNPYPSAIDADKFIDVNKNIINGALYFWTHNTAITNNEYTADDYASYTLTGGTGTGVGVGNFVDANNNGIMDPGEEVVSNRPLGKIAAGQSFFVESQPTPSATQFVFNNSMRVAGNNSQFFKQANTKKTAAVERNRVWLNLTNSKGAFKQLLVGYITGATNDWDNLYDGPTFDGQEFVDFYSVNQGKNLAIQGRALPFVDTDVVPLGYRSIIAGAFDISIDNRDGSLAGQEIWLEDKKTNTLHELSKSKYTFTAINGVENDRFVLKYTNKTLGTDDNEVADKSLIVSVKNKKITLTSSAEPITQVQIFDLLGRKVYDKSKINAQEWSISNLSSSEQTLIVKTTLANGAISNKKIIY